MPLPPDIPETRPDWLDKWPAKDEILALFSPGICQLGRRILMRERIRQLTWNATSLTLEIGEQRASWRLAGDQWRRSCSCGYRNGECAHTYAAAMLFLDICRKHGTLPASHKSPAPRPPRTGTAPASQTAPSPPNSRASTPQPALQHLVAEADFHHQPGYVTLRFYVNEAGRRRLLRMQQLLNLALRAKNTGDVAGPWSAHDRSFLCWLASQLRNKPETIQNLQVLKMPQRMFDNWLDHWESQPERFIERQSQQCLSRQGPATRLTIELSDAGPKVEIAAIVLGPGGRRYHFHEIFKMLASGKRDLVLDGQLTEFVPPISMDLLCELFSRKSPHMAKDKVCEYLPHLIENRLDIVTGPIVEHRRQKGRPSLHAEAEGADILIEARVDNAPLFPDSTTAAGHIDRRNDIFVITLYEGDDLNTVRNFLRDLPLERCKSGKWRLQGSPEQVEALVRGWDCLPPSVAKTASPQLSGLLTTPLTPLAELSIHENGRYFDTTVGWTCADMPVPDRDMRDALRQNRAILRTSSGNWLRLDTEAAAQAAQQLGEIGFGTGNRLFRPQLDQLLRETETNTLLSVSPRSRSLADRLRREPPARSWSLPGHLQHTLRHYQKEGFDFLSSRCAYHVGPILADDMGLGKTLQVISLLAAYFADARPGDTPRGALVVCPASVGAVWLAEIAKFCPELRAKAYRGTPEQRQEMLEASDWDVLVATYAIVRNDIADLANREFAFVILDEAQQIKNPEAQITRAVKQLRTPRPIALSGTPIENRLLDFWSIMDFLNPDFLGSQDAFADRFLYSGRHTDLADLIKPVMLRRTKDAVATELPPRTEEVILLDLAPEQQAYYDRELRLARERVRQKGPMQILAALTRLRQISCHPQLLQKSQTTMESAKLTALLEMLEELTAEGHSALVFSQFTAMLDIVRNALADKSIPTLTITGSTPVPRREQLVRDFQETDQAQVFLLSLKAAGTGLTLTKADYVFIFDPWWNPAVERQAIDRTHRIGQDKPIIAYRLVAANTVEEKVLKLQQEKAHLFDSFMEAADAGAAPTKLTAADLGTLLG